MALHGITAACAAMRALAGNEISGNGAIDGTTIQWFADRIGDAVDQALEHLDTLDRSLL